MSINPQVDTDTMVTIIYVVVDAICHNIVKIPAQKQKLTDVEVITIAICSAHFYPFAQ